MQLETNLRNGQTAEVGEHQGKVSPAAHALEQIAQVRLAIMEVKLDYLGQFIATGYPRLE